MAFNTNTGKQSFTAIASQTEFDFNFKIFDNTDLLVYQTLAGQVADDVSDILILTTDYTVAITGDTGGKVTLNTGAGVGDTIVIQRNLPLTRDTEYQTSGDLRATVINEDQDYQTYLILDSILVSDSALRLGDSSVGVDAKLPNVIPQNFLRVTAAGTGFEFVQGVVQEITKFNTTDFRIFTGTKNISFVASAIAAGQTRSITMPDADVDLADVNNAVLLTGNQTIAGIKTFSSSPIVPAPTTDLQAATKKYVDDNITSPLDDLTIGQEITIDSWSFVTTTITINTAVPHNLSGGQEIRVNGLVSTTNTPQGIYTVTTVEDTDTITVTAAATPTGTPTVSSATLSSGDIFAKGKFRGKNVCTAWAKVDGTATPPTISGSFNVKDVVRTGTGIYDVNFEVTMDDANYAGVASRDLNVFDSNVTVIHGNSNTTKVQVRTTSGGAFENDEFMVAVFGGRE